MAPLAKHKNKTGLSDHYQMLPVPEIAQKWAPELGHDIHELERLLLDHILGGTFDTLGPVSKEGRPLGFVFKHDDGYPRSWGKDCLRDWLEVAGLSYEPAVPIVDMAFRNRGKLLIHRDALHSFAVAKGMQPPKFWTLEKHHSKRETKSATIPPTKESAILARADQLFSSRMGTDQVRTILSNEFNIVRPAFGNSFILRADRDRELNPPIKSAN